MEKTLYDLDKLEEILGKAKAGLTDTEKAIYFAAANVLASNLMTRWNEIKLSSILYIEAEMKDLMWHMNVMLGYTKPVISMHEHHLKAQAKLVNIRRSIHAKRVVNMEFARP
jgi:hypothetical protein